MLPVHVPGVVVVPGRHGGAGGEAGHPGDAAAGGRVDHASMGAVARDQGRVVDWRTPNTAGVGVDHGLLGVGEWEVIDVAGDTGIAGVGVLLLETRPADGVIMVSSSTSTSLDVQRTVLVEDGPLGLCVLSQDHLVPVLLDQADEHDGEEDQDNTDQANN